MSDVYDVHDNRVLSPESVKVERTLRRFVFVLNVLIFLVPLLVGIFIGYAVLR